MQSFAEAIYQVVETITALESKLVDEGQLLENHLAAVRNIVAEATHAKRRAELLLVARQDMFLRVWKSDYSGSAEKLNEILNCVPIDEKSCDKSSLASSAAKALLGQLDTKKGAGSNGLTKADSWIEEYLKLLQSILVLAEQCNQVNVALSSDTIKTVNDAKICVAPLLNTLNEVLITAINEHGSYNQLQAPLPIEERFTRFISKNKWKILLGIMLGIAAGVAIVLTCGGAAAALGMGLAAAVVTAGVAGGASGGLVVGGVAAVLPQSAQPVRNARSNNKPVSSYSRFASSGLIPAAAPAAANNALPPGGPLIRDDENQGADRGVVAAAGVPVAAVDDCQQPLLGPAPGRP